MREQKWIKLPKSDRTVVADTMLTFCTRAFACKKYTYVNLSYFKAIFLLLLCQMSDNNSNTRGKIEQKDAMHYYDWCNYCFKAPK